MLETLDVDDPKAVAVFSLARQRRIVMVLIDTELSLSGLAQLTDMPLNLLHYHVGKLVRLGLINVARQAARGGAPIRYYRSAARSFFVPVERMIAKPGAELRRHLREALDLSLQSALQGVRYWVEDRKPRMQLIKAASQKTSAELWFDLRLSPDDASALAEALRSLLLSFEARSNPSGQRHIVHAAIASV